MDETLIERFLKDRRRKDAGEQRHGIMVPNRIGRALQRAGASPVIALMGLDSAVDQTLLTLSSEQATKQIFEVLREETREAIDPSLFAANATFCSLLGRKTVVGTYYGTDLLFITARGISEGNVQVLLKVFSLKLAGISTASSSLRAIVKKLEGIANNNCRLAH